MKCNICGILQSVQNSKLNEPNYNFYIKLGENNDNVIFFSLHELDPCEFLKMPFG